ncbi:YsnF/AvaK domain-containing protein [Hymenobacter bucti]|uniref:YsnF/AvaK domain-containing protein n=1 Tax=Hymenobacter bucti TaxID=1844114 RepID=A0ABW4R1I2_9BACT
MDQTVVGMFDTAAQAQQAAQQLSAAGFGVEHVDVSNAKHHAGSSSDTDSSDYQNTSGTAVEGVADAAGRTAQKTEEGIGGFFSSLFGGDDDTNDTAQRYQHVAQSTGSIVTVHCQSAEHAHKAAQILDEAGAVDVDERAAATGYQGNAQANSYTNTNATANTAGTDGLTAEVIEESLQVGKRTEQTGGVRLRSRIVEKPVEASVRLREEHVVVSRTPVNRPATEADFTAFKEGQIEVTESAERAVVAKEAHVVEEVSLGKQVTEREEVVRDTVRNTEVEVEQIPTSTNSTVTNTTAPNSDQTTRSNS